MLPGISISVYPTQEPSPLSLHLNPNLAELLLPSQGLFAHLTASYRHFSRNLGIPLPELTIILDKAIPTGEYAWKIHGVIYGRGVCRSDALLAIGEEKSLYHLIGEPTQEPIYGLPARWISHTQASQAHDYQCLVLDAPGIIATHLTNILTEQSHLLVTLASIEKRLQQLLPQHSTLLTVLRKTPGH